MKHVETFEKWAYRIALLLTLLAAARLGWTWTQLNARTVQYTPVPTVEQSPPSGLAGAALAAMPTTGLQMMMGPEAINSAIAAAVGTAPASVSSNQKPASPHREFISSFLSVQAGPARSELRVNGALVGQTPFLGQISCEQGQTVKLDVLPPKGVPKRYEIPCLAGEMRLRDEP
jgi:hypothetical protein